MRRRALRRPRFAVPGIASAHGRAATVALDYRLPVDPAVARSPAITACDPRRRPRPAADRRPGVRVVVLGDLGEPMLRARRRRLGQPALADRAGQPDVAQPAAGLEARRHGRVVRLARASARPPPFATGPTAGSRLAGAAARRRTAHLDQRLVRAGAATGLLAVGLAAALVAIGPAAVALQRAPQLRLAITVGSGRARGRRGPDGADRPFAPRRPERRSIGWALDRRCFAIGADRGLGLLSRSTVCGGRTSPARSGSASR